MLVWLKDDLIVIRQISAGQVWTTFIGRAVYLVFAAPLHLLRRRGLEDGVAVIADQLGGGVYKRGDVSRQGPAVDIESLTPAYLVGHRARTR